MISNVGFSSCPRTHWGLSLKLSILRATYSTLYLMATDMKTRATIITFYLEYKIRTVFCNLIETKRKKTRTTTKSIIRS